MAKNPLLSPHIFSQGSVALYDEVEPHHILPAIQHTLEKLEKEFLLPLEEPAEKPKTWAEIMQPLDEIASQIELVWSPVTLLLSTNNSKELRDAHDAVVSKVVEFLLRISQSEPIYKDLTVLSKSKLWDSLTPEQQFVIRRKIQSAELSGIALQGKEREEFNKNESGLSLLKSKFSNTILDARKARTIIFDRNSQYVEAIKALPETLLQIASDTYNSHLKSFQTRSVLPEGPWEFTLDPSNVIQFLENCRNTQLREKIWTSYVSLVSYGEFDNTQTMDDILVLRNRKAKLLGFNNYLAFRLAERMARTEEEVNSLLEMLRVESWDKAVEEHEELSKIANDFMTGPPQHWDTAFLAKRLEERRFNLKEDEIKPFFPFPVVQKGLFELAQELFNISIEESKEPLPSWHQEVKCYDVFDGDTKERISCLYVDPYVRSGTKNSGAWMNPIRSRRVDPVTRKVLQIPIAGIFMNYNPPVGPIPSLLTFRDVQTLFHEFGHALQHMLTKVDIMEAAGISGIEWDAVEIPSQWMENFCFEERIIQKISQHWNTQKPLPSEEVKQLTRMRKYRAASQMLRQINFGMVDLAVHVSYDPSDKRSPPIYQIQHDIAEKTQILPRHKEDKFLASFSHIFAGGYDCGYYSYKWAEVFSASAFVPFVKDGKLLEGEEFSEMGKRFRRTILELGSSQPSMQTFLAFRGEKPNPKDLCQFE